MKVVGVLSSFVFAVPLNFDFGWPQLSIRSVSTGFALAAMYDW